MRLAINIYNNNSTEHLTSSTSHMLTYSASSLECDLNLTLPSVAARIGRNLSVDDLVPITDVVRTTFTVGVNWNWFINKLIWITSTARLSSSRLFLTTSSHTVLIWTTFGLFDHAWWLIQSTGGDLRHASVTAAWVLGLMNALTRCIWESGGGHAPTVEQDGEAATG